jgi:dTDP-4-dehydrorhamnose 3,5-epimerase
MPMPVSIEEAPIPGLLIVKTGVFHDDRGFFSESYSRPMWAEAGFTETFVQDNLSRSRKGTLRGMHYQIEPDGMGKLVRCVQGSVYDVAVDLRKGSPTYGKWHGLELSGDNHLSFWVPAGFAHGFVALEDNTLVHYKCTTYHAPARERALNYACPKVGIHWPMTPTVITQKDADAPELDQVDTNFVWQGG